MRTFHLACALGTLQAVANRRHVTLGAVSQQIKRLEQQLDRQLLIRTRNGVHPTADGAQLQAQSAALMREHQGLLDQIWTRPAAGLVRLGLPEEYVPRLLDRLLPALRRHFPRIRLHVRTDNSGNLNHAIATGELDMAIVVHPERADSGDTRLWRTRPVWAGAVDKRVGEDEILALALHPESCPYRALGLAALEAAARDWETVFASASVTAIESAVASGLAISVLDRARLNDRMQEIGASAGLPPLPDCFACLRQTPEPPAAQTPAIRAVREQLLDCAFAVAPPSPA